jgi:ubiquinone/menaquinone biosynthesis C-methylase UbiE
MSKNFNKLADYLVTQDNNKIFFDKNFFTDKKNRYNLINNSIPNFFIEDEQTKEITNLQDKFYNEIKFPNYDDLDDYASLIDKANNSIFAKFLDEQIKFGSKILEVGCGTGQLSNFLSRYNRKIFAIDLSESSLTMAENFRKKSEIENVYFMKMNLFNLLFKDNFFDYIISIGCLHHTQDPKKAFFSIEKKLKKGGYIVVGLYHKYGRIYTKLRKIAFSLFGKKVFFLDKYLRNKNISYEKRLTWFRDQYQSPHEISYSIKEVLNWFEEKNLKITKILPIDNLNINSSLFKFNENNKNYNNLKLKELMLALNINHASEGGLFTIIAKKND